MQEKLEQLKGLYEKGLITKEVYEAQQQAVLAGAGGTSIKEPASSDLLDVKKNISVLVRIAVLIGAVLLGIFIVYSLSGREGKDAISEFASQTGVGKQVIPWSDRADTAARALVEANKQSLADAIQGIAHPTGENPVLGDVKVNKFAGHILVNIAVDWKGGLLGGSYRTVVTWDIGEKDHREAKVTSDNAMYAVEKKNAEVLNDYFRTKVYPAFYSDVGGG